MTKASASKNTFEFDFPMAKVNMTADIVLTPHLADTVLVSVVPQRLRRHDVQMTELSVDDLIAAQRSQLPERWDAAKHGPELRKLIVKYAVEGENLPTKDRARLQSLQAMRRETLPCVHSYEEFKRERDRLSELRRLTDQFAEYKRKFAS